ncbi:MBOAT family O-acyltransferase [Aliiruegeria lutimaris]|uniref:Probable alginate O-acetylase AlgI n=1 Tax=Aliiruegeria lutimaris TaxID=571298 RepID=A0A1G9DDW5_9RHOB|nr:MBOAT family O-acyltransferase [Aliiruegeria lutimaris]SDK62007.1 alginate O-acetyltransferase complex protein AlgI [Aliiruegeria lutimaris]
MLFSSPSFLYAFLPLVLAGCYLTKTVQARNVLLLCASVIFYTWGELKYLPLIFTVIAVTHMGAVYQVRAKSHHQLVLGLSVTTLLALLAFFKYYGFVVENLNAAGITLLPELTVALPLGISFFTFQAISQLVDVCRHRDEAKFQHPTLLRTALYIILFPQLIAGPIVRWGSVVSQMGKRLDTPLRRSVGAKLFVLGLASKVIIADNVAPIADHAFSLGSALDMGEAWFGVTAYALQIFFDFAGYSNMAIGLGLFFGFKFPTNFRDPYVSQSITEFWRRWHISLSSWFRDYVYIPLGGNRHGQTRTIANLLIVFLATGIWHGAAWNFVVWGMWHGSFLVLERFFGRPRQVLVARIYTLLVVLLGWVFFRAATLGDATTYIGGMFGMDGDGVISPEFYSSISNEILVIFGVGLFFGLTPRAQRDRIWKRLNRIGWLSNLWFTILLVICMIYVANSTYSPFLYFRF